MLKAAGPYWIERRMRAMGSDAHFVVGDAEPALVEWAVRELERLESTWSRFLPDSELARIHASAGAWVSVSPAMLDALEKAQQLWEATGGLFDPTVRLALEAAGYDRSFALIPPVSAEPPPVPMPAPGLDLVEVDPERARVRLPVGVGLDLGGLGKGLAADRLAEGLVDRGARTALISLGGDIRAAGEPPDGAWSVPVEDPLTEGRIAYEHRLASGALITTTRQIRTWLRAGQRMHHLIDPRSGASASSDVVAVVAAGAQAWWAEGIAKAALIAGSGEATGMLREAGLEGIAYCRNGREINVRRIGAAEVLECSAN
jgi:thiamine biosynthesis lipoprotein